MGLKALDKPRRLDQSVLILSTTINSRFWVVKHQILVSELDRKVDHQRCRAVSFSVDGEMGRWGDGEMGRWGDGEMGRWGDGEIAPTRELNSSVPAFGSGILLAGKRIRTKSDFEAKMLFLR